MSSQNDLTFELARAVTALAEAYTELLRKFTNQPMRIDPSAPTQFAKDLAEDLLKAPAEEPDKLEDKPAEKKKPAARKKVEPKKEEPKVEEPAPEPEPEEEPAQEEAPAEEEITPETIQQMLIKLSELTDRATAKKALTEVGKAAKVSAVKKEDYPALHAELKQAISDAEVSA